jgi:hypothetical protein
MSDAEATHVRLTKVRGRAYAELFDDKPDKVFPAHKLRTGDDDPFLIDVFVYSFEMEGRDGPIQAAVTNGMSDRPMVEGDEPDLPRRREIVQYFRDCTLDHAKRLRDMAWLPHFDQFHLDSHQTIAWEYPAVKGTPWKNALFLLPLLRPHREFTMDVDGDEVSLLWHVPISAAERAYRKEHGVDGLIDRMQAIQLPWVFDEDDRPSLVD